jgi:hypothetical protein
MAAVTTPLPDRARSIFADMGYDVSGDGAEFRASRKWRSVRVSVADATDDLPDGGDLRCFVTDREEAGTLRDRLARAKPEYDWAVLGVDDEGYEVLRGAGWARA